VFDSVNVKNFRQEENSIFWKTKTLGFMTCEDLVDLMQLFEVASIFP